MDSFLLTNEYSPSESLGEFKPRAFRFWGRWTASWKWTLVAFAALSCFGGFGQQVALPLYLSALGPFGGPYFVLWFCSFIFTIFFGVGALFLYRNGQISAAMLNPRWLKWMFFVGFFDALNGIFMVYSAPLSRVPGPLQSILIQLITPFTLIFSKLILRDRHYNWRQLAGVGLVLLGAIYSLIPLFVHAARGDIEEGSGMTPGTWWWPLVLIAGVIPGALMSVVQEDLQDKFREHPDSRDNARMSVFYFQAVESFFQLVCMSVFFFFDVLPQFGTNPSSLSGFDNSFRTGFQCFFGNSSQVAVDDRCAYAGALGALFIIAYICSYVFGTFMTLYATANYNAVVTTLPPVCALIFWFAFPSVNSWADGTPYSVTSMDGAINITALVIMIPGILLYRRNETVSKATETHDGFEEIPYFPVH